MAETTDLVNRDPNNINDHIKVAFEDVLAEPEGIHSIDCVWTTSFLCFNSCKNCWYNLFTFFCGIFVAMEWGMVFACMAIQQVWCVTPWFKVMEVNCGCAKKLYGLCVHCCLDPFFEAFGLIFSAFKKVS